MNRACLIILLSFLSLSILSQDIVKELHSQQNSTKITFRQFYPTLEDSVFGGTSIWLYSDSMFHFYWKYSEGVYVGKWTVRNGSLIMDHINLRKSSYVKNIQLSKKSAKKHVLFVINNRCGDPCQDIVLTPVKKGMIAPKPMQNYGSHHIIFEDEEDEKNNELYLSDDYGRVKIDVSRYDSLVLSMFDYASGSHYSFSTKKLTDTVTIEADGIGNLDDYRFAKSQESCRPIKVKILYKNGSKRDWELEWASIDYESLD